MPAETVSRGDTPLYQNPLVGRCPFFVNSGIGIDFIPHWHGEIEILYIMPVSGDTQPALTVICEGERFCLRERDALIISSGMVHSLQTERKDFPMLTLEMGFPLLGEDFDRFARKRFEAPLLRFSEDVPPALLVLEQLLRDIAAEPAAGNQQLQYEPSAQAAASRMRIAASVFRIAALLAEHMPMLDASDTHVRRMQAMLTVQPVLSYVRENYSRRITLETAAALMGYEKTRFCQLFRCAVGVPFHRYLTAFRLNAARALLQETTIPISAVGEAVGILQHKTFSRLFRASYGCSPREMREEVRNAQQRASCDDETVTCPMRQDQ